VLLKPAELKYYQLPPLAGAVFMKIFDEY